MSEYEMKNKELQTVHQPEATGEQLSQMSVLDSAGSASPSPRLTLRSLRAATEVQAINWALEQTGWNRKRAAELLSISYRGLLYKIHQHNITPPVDSPLTPPVEGEETSSISLVEWGRR